MARGQAAAGHTLQHDAVPAYVAHLAVPFVDDPFDPADNAVNLAAIEAHVGFEMQAEIAVFPVERFRDAFLRPDLREFAGAKAKRRTLRNAPLVARGSAEPSHQLALQSVQVDGGRAPQELRERDIARGDIADILHRSARRQTCRRPYDLGGLAAIDGFVCVAGARGALQRGFVAERPCGVRLG